MKWRHRLLCVGDLCPPRHPDGCSSWWLCAPNERFHHAKSIDAFRSIIEKIESAIAHIIRLGKVFHQRVALGWVRGSTAHVFNELGRVPREDATQVSPSQKQHWDRMEHPTSMVVARGSDGASNGHAQRICISSAIPIGDERVGAGACVP